MADTGTSTNPEWWERAVAGLCSHGGHGDDGETCSDYYADSIMAEIDHDISIGQVPATVASFAELHDHVDGNDYALQCIPQDAAGCWDEWMELANEVEAEVSRRLAARAAQVQP